MPGSFFSPSREDIERIYLDDYSIIDQYVQTGSLWMWGSNKNGNLGNNSVITASSPVQTISVGINWKQVSVSSNSFTGNTLSLAIKTDGTLWTWGDNVFGQMGNSSVTRRSSPGQAITGGTNWKQVSSGGDTAAAIKTDGTLWTWGRNSYGQLGANNVTSRSSPGQVVGANTDWKYVAAGELQMAAIKTDGTLWVWGDGTFGKLGNGAEISRSSPIQTAAANNNWKYVAVGTNNIAGIKENNTLWLWGLNTNGQLGDGTVVSKSTPVQTVSATETWKQVALSSDTVAAIKTDGTLWTWGNNTLGSLGTGNVVSRSSPGQTISTGTNWKQVSMGIQGGAAIKTDGTLWTWGLNQFGTIGDSTLTAKSSPVQTVSLGSNWKQVSCDGANTVGAIYFYDIGNLFPPG